MVNPTDHVENPVQDPPPDLAGSTIFTIPKMEELMPTSNPIYKDELLETLHSAQYQTDLIPGSFTFHHINQMAAKA